MNTTPKRRRAKPASYCEAAEKDPALRSHHDTEHGFPCSDDNRLFEYLMLEINQAGLSWKLIINKRQGFQRAFENFAVDVVANYGETDINRLLQDTGIIRSKAKIAAAIYNAQQIRQLQQQHGSFAAWLNSNYRLDKDEWIKTFKQHFRFVGPEVISEYLIGIGLLPGAHLPTCPIYYKIATLNPLWQKLV